MLKDGGLVVVARLLVVLVIVGFVVSWDDLVGMLFDVVQVLGREVCEFRDRDFDRPVLPANFYIIIQQMLDSYNNNNIISTANAVIIVLQFVSISQPSLYHL